jgi:hypothetical protein
MLEHEVSTEKLADESVTSAVLHGCVVSKVAARIGTMAEISVRTARNAGLDIDCYWSSETFYAPILREKGVLAFVLGPENSNFSELSYIYSFFL